MRAPGCTISERAWGVKAAFGSAPNTATGQPRPSLAAKKGAGSIVGVFCLVCFPSCKELSSPPHRNGPCRWIKDRSGRLRAPLVALQAFKIALQLQNGATRVQGSTLTAPPSTLKILPDPRHRLAAMGRDAAAIRDHVKDPRRGKGPPGAPRDRGQIGGATFRAGATGPSPLPLRP